MGNINVDQFHFEFKPASYTANSQPVLFTVRDSYLQIVSCIVRVETAFTAGAPVLKVGTVATTDLLVSATDVTEGSVGVYKGTGSGLTGGGALIPNGTAIIVDWTGAGLTTQGLARVVITAFRVGV